jgi:hypothetical protein
MAGYVYTLLQISTNDYEIDVYEVQSNGHENLIFSEHQFGDPNTAINTAKNELQEDYPGVENMQPKQSGTSGTSSPQTSAGSSFNNVGSAPAITPTGGSGTTGIGSNNSSMVEITKERYDEIKNKELSENNLDVYEVVDDQQDADDMIAAGNFAGVDEGDVINESDSNWIFTAPDDSKYVDKNTRNNSVSPPNGATPFTGGGVGFNCSDIQNNFNSNLKISKYFTLGQVAVDFSRLKDKTVGDKTYTKYQLACNLKALAVNVLDKIKDQYPDMTINSTIRNLGTKSEHETAQAADLIFPKHKKKEYYDIVLWIYQNTPWNQLFIEYRPNNSTYKGVSYKGNPRGGWIHVSFQQKGNQVYGAPHNWGCMVNDKFENPGSFKSFTNPMANNDWYA